MQGVAAEILNNSNFDPTIIKVILLSFLMATSLSGTATAWSYGSKIVVGALSFLPFLPCVILGYFFFREGETQADTFKAVFGIAAIAVAIFSMTIMLAYTASNRNRYRYEQQ